MKFDKLEGSRRGKLASEPLPFLPELEALLVLAGALLGTVLGAVLGELVLVEIEMLGTESMPPPFPEPEELLEALGNEAVPPFAEALDTESSADAPNTTKQAAISNCNRLLLRFFGFKFNIIIPSLTVFQFSIIKIC